MSGSVRDAGREVALVDYSPDRLDAFIPMWRESFESGVGVRDPHPLAEQARYFSDVVLPENTVRLAVAGDQLVGFVAASPESIAQLYVRVGFHRQGIGGLLLDWAKAQSAGSLWLYTFARNQGARRFYERHGFIAMAHGFEPGWQLEDVRSMWTGGAGVARFPPSVARP